MPQFDLICLANSWKLGGHCVAGLRTDGAGWLRPVGPIRDGSLYLNDYVLDDMTEVGVLDVIRVGVSAPRPAIHQPENWTIDGTRWGLLERPASSILASVIQSAVHRKVELIVEHSDRLAYADLQHTPAPASLALIAPKEIELYSQLNFMGRPRARGRFTLNSPERATQYDLSVTDPTWTARIIAQGRIVFRNPADRVLLTISIGEEFGGFCYKIIAAIIPIPVEYPIVF